MSGTTRSGTLMYSAPMHSGHWWPPGFRPRAEHVARALVGLLALCVTFAAWNAAVASPAGPRRWIRSPADQALLLATGIVFLLLAAEVVLAGPPRPHRGRRATWVLLLRRASVAGAALVFLGVVLRTTVLR